MAELNEEKSKWSTESKNIDKLFSHQVLSWRELAAYLTVRACLVRWDRGTWQGAVGETFIPRLGLDKAAWSRILAKWEDLGLIVRREAGNQTLIFFDNFRITYGPYKGLWTCLRDMSGQDGEMAFIENDSEWEYQIQNFSKWSQDGEGFGEEFVEDGTPGSESELSKQQLEVAETTTTSVVEITTPVVEITTPVVNTTTPVVEITTPVAKKATIYKDVRPFNELKEVNELNDSGGDASQPKSQGQKRKTQGRLPAQGTAAPNYTMRATAANRPAPPAPAVASPPNSSPAKTQTPEPEKLETVEYKGILLLADETKSMYARYHGARPEPYERYKGDYEFQRPNNVPETSKDYHWDRLQIVAECLYDLDEGRSAPHHPEKYTLLLAPIVNIRHEGFFVPKAYLLKKWLKWLWKNDEYIRTEAGNPATTIANKAQFYFDLYMKKRSLSLEERREETDDRRQWRSYETNAQCCGGYKLSIEASRGEFIERDETGQLWFYTYEVPKEEQEDNRMWWIKYPDELIPLLLEDRKKNGKLQSQGKMQG